MYYGVYYNNKRLFGYYSETAGNRHLPDSGKIIGLDIFLKGSNEGSALLVPFRATQVEWIVHHLSVVKDDVVLVEYGSKTAAWSSLLGTQTAETGIGMVPPVGESTAFPAFISITSPIAVVLCQNRQTVSLKVLDF